jgi:hypothetical protein
MNIWVIIIILLSLFLINQTESFTNFNRGFGLKFNGIGCWSNFFHYRNSDQEHFSSYQKGPGKFDQTTPRSHPYNWLNDCDTRSGQYTGHTWCVDPEVYGCNYNTKRLDCKCGQSKCQCKNIKAKNFPGWESSVGSPASILEGFSDEPINQVTLVKPKCHEILLELEKGKVTPKLVELVRKIRAKHSDISTHPEFSKMIRMDKIRPC